MMVMMHGISNEQYEQCYTVTMVMMHSIDGVYTLMMVMLCHSGDVAQHW